MRVFFASKRLLRTDNCGQAATAGSCSQDLAASVQGTFPVRHKNTRGRGPQLNPAGNFFTNHCSGNKYFSALNATALALRFV